MKNEKRKLHPYEKVLFGVKVLMCVISVVFFVYYFVHSYIWAHCAAWMCLDVAYLTNCFTRWEERKKLNIFGICAFSVLFVIFGCMLVWSLL